MATTLTNSPAVATQVDAGIFLHHCPVLNVPDLPPCWQIVDNIDFHLLMPPDLRKPQ